MCDLLKSNDLTMGGAEAKNIDQKT